MTTINITDIEIMIKIAPKILLDIGVEHGFGGVIIRNLMDIRYNRFTKDQWEINIEGISTSSTKIEGSLSYYYDQLYNDDISSFLEKQKKHYDLILFNKPIININYQKALLQLQLAIEKSNYIIIKNQEVEGKFDEKAEDFFISNLSTDLGIEIFTIMETQVHYVNENDIGNAYLISKNDPKHIIKESVNSAVINYQLPDFIHISLYETIQNELQSIKKSKSYNLLLRFRESGSGKFTYKIYALFMKLMKNKKKHISEYEFPLKENKYVLEKKSYIQSKNDSSYYKEYELWRNSTPSDSVISIQHPNWLGIHSSASQLFDQLLDIPDNLNKEKANIFASILQSVSPSAIVIHGFPPTYHYLFDAVHKRLPKVPVYSIWHGSYLHTDEDTNWYGFKYLWYLSEQKIITKWGFVKKGMAESVAKCGLNTGFVENYVRQIPQHVSEVPVSPKSIGIWGSGFMSWRKAPYAMLSGISGIPDLKVTLVGHDADRVLDFSKLFNIDVNYYQSIKPEKMITILSKMHLNMYVTLNECTPMLPLESLSNGVPCIIGPNSHLFEDNPYLFSRLVVPFPDRNDIIGQYAEQAINERNQIIEEYIDYAHEYNAHAQNTLINFLDGCTPRDSK
ncbi:MAG: hypothetical protein JEZ03_10240 [Bacteroidales bacterium]|nr:hypothetical protein [Bacteroidales bacterium]